MLRIFALRLSAAWWAIPLTYMILLPLLYLLTGDFEGELSHLNDFVISLWNGW